MSDLKKLSKDELAEITLRLLKATEGKWMPSPKTGVLGSGVVSAPQGRVVAMGVASDDDAEFIAAAHADVEHLLDHITAMEAEQQRVASRTANDAFEVGAANIHFADQLGARIRELEAVLANFMLIQEEMNQQDAKWGDQSQKHPATWVAILVEEVGEVAKAVLEGNSKECSQELVQVAAVAVQFIRAVAKQTGQE